MTALPLVFIAGVLGSSHCIGMCGPFALTIGTLGEGPATGGPVTGGPATGGKRATSRWMANLGRQTIYTLGRIFTYAVFGTVAGAAGLYLNQNASSLINAAALLAIVAGLFLVYQGLLAARVFRRRLPNTSAVPCLAGKFFSTFLRAPGWRNIFLAGLFTGMLPCGLVYGFVALAASSGDPLAGAGLMIAFGLGTAPVMMLAGCGSALIGPRARQHAYRIAAWCVVLTGLISIARGAGFVDLPGWISATGCPWCE